MLGRDGPASLFRCVGSSAQRLPSLTQILPPPPPPQICCSFGVDVLEALAASCTQVAARGWTRRASTHLACDVVVACALLMVHGATLMSQVGRRRACLSGAAQRCPGLTGGALVPAYGAPLRRS